MILVLSTARDEHAQAVLAALARRETPAKLVDLSEFPRRMRLSMGYAGKRRDYAFGCTEGDFSLEDCGSIWWRRPQPPEVSPEIQRSSHRHFALAESTEALQGLWQAVDAFWMNEPARDMVAQRKAYQLRVAQEVGLVIPDTLITNCPRAASEFVARRGCERVVYKSFSATLEEWRETRLLRPAELDLIEYVQYAPVIFQEYVEADIDLRITVVGDAIFPAAVHSQETAYRVDCRMDISNARIEACELPAEVEAGLRRLMRHLGLAYGAIDMRRTPEGRYVFLEINPAGQWLFIEQHTRQPITDCMAEILRRHDEE